MVKPQTGTDAEALVQRSLLFRMARQIFVSLDAAAERSRLLPALTRSFTLATAGRVLIVASLTHAAIVTAIPLTQAPLWRYGLAVTGLIAGVALEFVSRAFTRSTLGTRGTLGTLGT